MTLPIGNVPQIPFQLASGGLRTELGTFTPPGGRVVAYVHHAGAARLADITAATTVPVVHKTLNAALAACQSGWGDTVLVLPGHAENISVADQMSNLKAGTRIIGLGNGNLRPTFTWTTATATFLLDVANVRIENCILNMDPGAGTVTVAAPMTVSAAGCQVVNCKIRMGTDANSKVTVGVTTTAAADDMEILNCDVYGGPAAECQTFFSLVGADRLRFHNNRLMGATSNVAIGLITFTSTGSLGISISNCQVFNTKALSTTAINSIAATTGTADQLLLGVLADNANQLTLGHADGAWGDSAAGMIFGLNVGVVNLAGESAARATPLST